MNAKRIGIVMLVLVAALMVGLNVVSAQDNPGNGNGGSNGRGGYSNGSNAGSPCGNCIYQNAQNGYQNGMNAGSWRGGHGNASRGNGRQNGAGGYYGAGMFYRLPPASTGALPQDVVDLMIDGWLDEQHAYAVYEAVTSQFGDVRPFVNIQNAEAHHIAAWQMLFDRYGIKPGDVPPFDVPQFASITDACAAGAAAEVANFDLYDTMISAFAPYPDLLYVAQSLRDASEYSHLSAFENCAP